MMSRVARWISGHSVDTASSTTVTLHSIADHVKEKTETATMTLATGSGYKVGSNKSATVSIKNGP